MHLKSTADDWMALLGLDATPVAFNITPIEKLLDIERPVILIRIGGRCVCLTIVKLSCITCNVM